MPEVEWAKERTALADDLSQVEINDINGLLMKFAERLLHHIISIILA